MREKYTHPAFKKKFKGETSTILCRKENVFCGDTLVIFQKKKDKSSVFFESNGCSLLVVASEIFCKLFKNRKLSQKTFKLFEDLITGKEKKDESKNNEIGELIIFKKMNEEHSLRKECLLFANKTFKEAFLKLKKT
jgi:NifU-like protein involved in Fe-S cluster formation